MVRKFPRLLDIFCAFHLQEAIVHPDLRHPFAAEGAAGLRDLVLVMREYEVDAATMNIEGVLHGVIAERPPPKGSSSVAIDMAEHSICQPGRPLPGMPQGLAQPGS